MSTSSVLFGRSMDGKGLGGKTYRVEGERSVPLPKAKSRRCKIRVLLGEAFAACLISKTEPEMLDEKFVNAALSKHHQKVDPPAMANPILLEFWFCKAEGYLEKIWDLLGATSEGSKTHPFFILWADYKDDLSKLASSKSLRQYVQNLHGMTEITNKTMLYLSQEASQFIQDEEDIKVLRNAFQTLWEDRIKTTLQDHIFTASRLAGNALVVSLRWTRHTDLTHGLV
ncbi:hypothetical protein QFC21_003015 [Naganishia friedmannii]|uniref:Uncharacterized protein n=1 Tax=Naganishia friedmannii TaxID=89922 RepID=A0ACC2VQS0_9TREE|nr:hypothetical protein QFC21_003015 [Naganishia friedmannii]